MFCLFFFFFFSVVWNAEPLYSLSVRVGWVGDTVGVGVVLVVVEEEEEKKKK